jgi:hypothetical protein
MFIPVTCEKFNPTVESTGYAGIYWVTAACDDIGPNTRLVTDVVGEPNPQVNDNTVLLTTVEYGVVRTRVEFT